MPIEERELRHRKLVVPVRFELAHPSTWQRGKPERDIRLICLHSAECGEVPNAAEALATWGAGAQHPRASWHLAVDSNSVTQSVELQDIAWHAGPINGYSIGIEQAGRAAQTAAQWDDAYSQAMLDRVARLLAIIAGEWNLPLEHAPNPRDPHAKGVCTHADVTRAWGTKGGHTDPGVNYPLEFVLALARGYQLEAVS